MVEGSSDQSLPISQENHQQALKEIYGFGYPFLYNKYIQGAENYNHQQEISGFGDPFRSWYKRGSEDNHPQEISGFGDPYRSWYKRGAEDNHQQEISGPEVLFKYKKGAEDNHQQEISGSENRLIYKQRAEDNDEQVKKENEHIHASFFFLMDDLKIGKTKTLSFQSRRNLISSPSNSLRYFFPKEAADSIPFSLKELSNVLQRFAFPKHSPQAKSMEDTLSACEDSPIKGETRICATSAEAMLDYVQGIMGEKTQIEALSTTTYFSKDSIRPQKYTILSSPQEVAAPKMVGCHLLPYAHAVFYCHNTVSKVRVFKISLGYEARGDRVVDAIAVCHMDTSQWNPTHESFQSLGILPGTLPICHYFSGNDLVWLPKPIVSTGHEAV